MRKIEKFGYLLMAMATNIVFSFKNVYYLIFLTNILEIDVAVAGIITMIGTIWDAVNDPLVGIALANHKFKSGEKVRPLLLRASVPWGITLVLLFCNFNAGKAGTIALCIFLYFVFETIYTMISVPYATMASLATGEEKERRAINTLRGIGAGIGSGIGAVAITPLIKLFGGLQGENAVLQASDANAILYTAIVMGGLCIFGSMFHYFTSKERVKTIFEGEKEERLPLFKSFKILLQSRSWRLNTIYFLLYGLNNIITMTIVSYYASYVLNASTMTTPILAAYMVFYLLGAALSPLLDKKMGRKGIMIFSLAVQMACKIPFFIVPNSLVTILINAASCGLGGSIIFVIAGTNRTTISDIVELKCKKRADSIVSASENLLLKLLEAGGQWVISFSLSLAGFEASLGASQTGATINVIYAFLGVVPFVICALSLIAILRLDCKKEYDELRRKSGNEKE